MINETHLQEKIRNRYEAESSQSCSLGCGNAMEALNIRAGEHVLDLGCGRGEETLQAARKAGPEGKATGLDLTEAMIAKAREHAAVENAENTEFVQGDIDALPFKACVFDGVMSNCVINHARDKKRVFSEIHRVLKPGGRFVVSDAVSKVPLPQEVKNDPEAWAQCFGGAVTEEEYLEAIGSAGFREIEVLNRREYLKNGYDFISLTIKAVK